MVKTTYQLVHSTSYHVLSNYDRAGDGIDLPLQPLILVMLGLLGVLFRSHYGRRRFDSGRCGITSVGTRVVVVVVLVVVAVAVAVVMTVVVEVEVGWCDGG